MGGFRIDSVVLSHPRVREAGLAAFGLWALAGTWCDEHLTDGHIPIAVAKTLMPSAATAASRVTQSGLWSECTTHERCFELRAYAADERGRRRQRTRAEVEAERCAERERKRLSRSRVHPAVRVVSTPDTTPDTGRTRSGLDTPSSNEVPPLSPPQGEPAPKTARPARRATPIPAGWGPSDGHRGYAAQHHLDVEAEAAKFRDHASMTGRLGRDWDAGFRMWLTKAVEFQAGRPVAATKPEPTLKPLRRFTADD